MKKKMLYQFLAAYAAFLILSFFITLVLVPGMLKNSLYEIAEDAEYYQYLHSQAVAIQNICYIVAAVILLLSLIPLFVFLFRIYRPFTKVVDAASGYVSGDSPNRPEYQGNDELGRLTASVNYLISSVENSNEYQRQFISNVSHDFRSPLTSIKGYVEAIQDGTIPYEMQDRYLNIVLSETERLNKLTEGILLLNTYDDDRMFLNLTDFDLTEIIDSTIDALEGTFQKKNIVIRKHLPSDQLLVHADRSRIQQVLYNLIDNAVKFSSADSEIIVSVQLQKSRLFVSVKDFGEGISKEHLIHIWDRFFKTDPSRGKDRKGNGLGLSIVKEIIRAHDQNINVISTEGVGTEFIFTLARAE